MPNDDFVAQRNVFITRPRAAGERMAETFRTRFGFTPILAPALDIIVEPGDLPAAGFAGIVASSAAGIEALAGKTLQRATPLYVIGEASAAIARALGFENIHIASTPDVGALAKLVIDTHPPDAGAVLYATGRDRRGDLAGALRAGGVPVETAILYRAEPCRELDAEARARLQSLTAGVAMMYSARSAAAFVALLKRVGELNALSKLIALCNAQATAAAACDEAERAGAHWARIAVADQPTDDAMFKLLKAISS